jgi:addiction module RelE/StbE family toxin
MRLVWTEPAIQDLIVARAFIAQDNPSAADRQIERVVAAVANLIIVPEMGRVGRCLGTRELAISRTPYIVAYRVGRETIDILRVMHERRRWPDHF